MGDVGGVGRGGRVRRAPGDLRREGGVDLALQLPVPETQLAARGGAGGWTSAHLSRTTFTDAIPCSCSIFSSTCTETGNSPYKRHSQEEELSAGWLSLSAGPTLATAFLPNNATA